MKNKSKKNQTLKMSRYIRLLPGHLISDAEAAKQFLKIHGEENVLRCKKNLWIFNKNTGKWTKDRREIWRDIINPLGDRLLMIQTRVDKDGNIVDSCVRKDYSTKGRSYDMLYKLSCFCHEDDNWEFFNNLK